MIGGLALDRGSKKASLRKGVLSGAQELEETSRQEKPKALASIAIHMQEKGPF